MSTDSKHGDRFYNWYINKKIKTKYLDDNGSGAKPKHFFTKTGIRSSFGYDPTQQMWDRNMKITNYNFGGKRKLTVYIYLPGYKYREVEGHLKLRSCLQDTLIKYSPKIGKYIKNLNCTIDAS